MTSTEAYEQQIANLAAKFGPEWRLRSFLQMPTRDGVAFTGKVLYHNLVVAMIENTGTGGPNSIFWSTRPDDASFYEQAEAAWRAIAGERGSLQEEAAIEALMQHAGV